MLDFLKRFLPRRQAPVFLKVKKLDGAARLPARGTPGSAGLDLTCLNVNYDGRHGQLICRTGVALEIPPGYVGLLFPRSSIVRKGVRLANCCGVIDSDYRGEVTFVFDVIDYANRYHAGERLGQLVIVPVAQMAVMETDELSPSLRGEGGYGSTGK